MSLAEFLLARIAEDEAAARAADSGRWLPEDKGITFEWYADDFHDGEAQARLRADTRANQDHIARWDPAHVLAECEAKRRILETHRPYRRIYGLGCDVCLHPRRLTVDVDGWPCPTLRLLALPYADHSDYQQEWRP